MWRHPRFGGPRRRRHRQEIEEQRDALEERLRAIEDMLEELRQQRQPAPPPAAGHSSTRAELR